MARAALLLAVLALAMPVAAQDLGSAKVTLAWSPEEPEPSFVLPLDITITYAWEPAALTTQPTRIELSSRASEIALNATFEPKAVSVQPGPQAGSATAHANLTLRWVFGPSNGRTAELQLLAHALANGNLPSAEGNATVVVHFPPGPAPAKTPPSEPPRAAPEVGGASLVALLALVSWARRHHG